MESQAFVFQVRRTKKKIRAEASCSCAQLRPTKRQAGSNTCWLPRHLEAVNNWRGWTLWAKKCKAGNASWGMEGAVGQGSKATKVPSAFPPRALEAAQLARAQQSPAEPSTTSSGSAVSAVWRRPLAIT
jgi:hypothetical protein